MSVPAEEPDHPPGSTRHMWIERLILFYGAFLTCYVVARLLVGERWSVVALVNSFVPWCAAGAAPCSLTALFFRRRWRLIVLQLPILVAFAGWYGDLYWPRDPVKVPDGIRITAANYNVLSGDSDPQRIGEVLAALDADLVGLEELGAEHAAYFQQQLAADYPYQSAHPNEVGFGLGLLSRYPILESRVLEKFENYRGDPRTALLRAVVDVQGIRVAVYVAHLPVPLPVSIHYQHGVPIPTFYDASRRHDQLTMLRDTMRDDPGPILLVCDCNMTDQADGHHTLDAVLNDSFREVGRGMGFTHESHLLPSWFPKLWRIDYVWHSESFVALRVRVGQENGMSDHYPMIADLVLTSDPAP